MANDPLKTNQKISNTGSAKVINPTVGWYLNKSQYRLREGNDFTPYFSGEQVFNALAASINKATKSIDIIAWGFDPAMPIVNRNGVWKLENTYGEILRKAANRGVRVRLLLWYTKLANGKMSNAIGKMGKATVIKINRGTKEATDYPEKWFTAAEKGTVAHLDVALRAIADQTVGNEDKRIGAESVSLSFPADHQKSVVIDYGYEGAHGYLMGHNSLTDYWDTVEMKHDDPRRELGKGPYHDFSLRIEGPCLHDLQHNFCDSWDDKATTSLNKKAALPEYERLKAMPLSCVSKTGKSPGQIIRTRPDKQLNGVQEKEIKRAYMMMTQNARKYMIIINQYMQYPRWARHLTEFSKKLKAAGHPRELHLFVFTSPPEDKRMVLRGHQMANELGVSDQFGTAETEVYDVKNQHKQATYYKALDSKAKKFKADLAKIGVNVVFCMLQTKVPPKKLATEKPKNIYIHAKLTIIDNVFFTLGSANLNMRSMAMDSEINLISHDLGTAAKLRRNVIRTYTDDAVKADINKDTKKFFSAFSKLALDNVGLVEERTVIIGHAVPFADDRSASYVSLS